YSRKCKLHIAYQLPKRAVERLVARNQHVIGAILQGERGFLKRLAQAAADAVADNGVAHFLGDGKAEARRAACRMVFGAEVCLQNEAVRGESLAVRRSGQEIPALLDGGQAHAEG